MHETADLSTSREDRALVLVAVAWSHATFRQAEAVPVLFVAGMADAAFGNARAAFEHPLHISMLRSAPLSAPSTNS